MEAVVPRETAELLQQVAGVEQLRRDTEEAYDLNGRLVRGPYYENRAMKRQNTGTEHRHDGSKKPTKGRVRERGWRGAKL